MTSAAGQLSAADLRERYGRPIIDGDGHTLEYIPALDSYIRAEGLDPDTAMRAMAAPPGSQRIRRAAYMSSLTHPAENTYDLATAQFPAFCTAGSTSWVSTSQSSFLPELSSLPFNPTRRSVALPVAAKTTT
jgi:hypothetical protein